MTTACDECDCDPCECDAFSVVSLIHVYMAIGHAQSLGEHVDAATMMRTLDAIGDCGPRMRVPRDVARLVKRYASREDDAAEVTRLRAELVEVREVAERNAADCAHLRQSAIALTDERDHYKTACIATAREIEDTLGRALFGEQAPAGEAPAWCVYTSEELAVMAAKEIAERTRESVETQAKAIAYPLVLRQSREVLDLLASVRAAAHDGDRTADERIRDVVALLGGET